MKAVILAAGKGTRLRPLTDSIPKPLARVKGKCLIDYSIEGLLESGISDIAVVIGYLGDQIVHHITAKHRANFSFIEQTDLNGTAGAVLLCRQHISDSFVMLYGDTYFSTGAVSTLAKEESYGSVGVIRSDHPENYGCVELDQLGFVINIIEKPLNPKSDLVVMGGYRFLSGFDAYLLSTPRSSRGELELPDAVRLSMQKGHQYKALEISGCSDVATLDDLKLLNTIS